VRRFLILAGLVALLVPLFLPVAALAEEAVDLPTIHPDPSLAARQRGEKVFRDICNQCHSMKFHKNSQDNKPYLAKTPAEDAKKAFGKVPPDLTLMAKARKGGSAHIYGILTGYDPDKNSDCTSAGGFNKYFPGNCIAMPSPGVTEAQARDVVAFLAWTAEPNEVQSRQMGLPVMAYTAFLAALLYLWKRRVWEPIKAKH